jgi:hypothetical protein
MANDIVQLDTPEGLMLSDLERKLVEGLASKRTPKDLSIEYGIPRTAITNLTRKPGVSEFIQELVDARNQLMKMYLPDLLMGIIEDKVAKNLEEDETRLADLSRKDVVDIARQLNDMLKTTGSEATTEKEDKFAKLYQQINVIQNSDKDKPATIEVINQEAKEE